MDDLSLYRNFKEPPTEYYPRPLWFWNEYPESEKLQTIMSCSKNRTKYNGFGIVCCDSSKLEYLSDEYLDYYEVVLKKARDLEMNICLYDEWWFPSGNACGQLQEKAPDYCAKRLDKYEYEVYLDKEVHIPIEETKLMSCVAMNKQSKEIRNIRHYIKSGELTWKTDESGWYIMIFYCVTDGWDRVNYLEPQAVEQFISLTHETYYARFKEYFGNVIDSAFYDEPQFYSTQGRMWSLNFNEWFEKDKGYNPEILYPALWYDIGEHTAYARNQLLGYRAHLYANGFPKVIQEWCTKHHIRLTGHVDVEEAVNPTGITGDLMKSFQFQDIPGIDEIFERYRAASAYKIVSSAAYNWDKPLVMCESYGGMGENIGIDGLYKEMIEEYVKGINLFIPHAVWTNNEEQEVIFPPELSYRSERYGEELEMLSNYSARLSYLLQGGRHIADVAVLYPIHSLHAEYYMDWGTPYDGGPLLENDNYQKLSIVLTDKLHTDFTFLHPEVLDQRCLVDSGKLILNNKVNYENYQVLLIPSMCAISSSNVEKILDFYQNGGKVIFIEKIPFHDVGSKSSEYLHTLLKQLFRCDLDKMKCCKEHLYLQHENGGVVEFIPVLDETTLKQAMKRVISVPDVMMEVVESDNNKPGSKSSDVCNNKGILSYIHKEKNGMQIYYFINSSDSDQLIDVALNGQLKLMEFDPMCGETKSIPVDIKDKQTNIKIKMKKTSSIFLVGNVIEGEIL